MAACEKELRFDFCQSRPLQVQFSDLELSSDAGILLARQADERLLIVIRAIQLHHGHQQLSCFHGYYGHSTYYSRRHLG